MRPAGCHHSFDGAKFERMPGEENMRPDLMSALVFMAVAGFCGGAAITKAAAGEADVVAAKATPDGLGVYRFSVTVEHADTGWDHFADNFEVLAPDGTILGTRILAHPHVDEQPFTRSLGGVAIPPAIKEVTIRAHDKVDGYGGKTVTVTLPDR